MANYINYSVIATQSIKFSIPVKLQIRILYDVRMSIVC